MKKLLTLTAIGGLLFATSNAQASGFFIREQSVSGMGNAFAGATAGAEDISYSFWNPAILTKHGGTQINGNLTGINPHITGTTDTQKSRHVVENAVVPAFYASHQLNDKLTAGVGISAPFGLVTDYADSFPNPIAHDVLSDLTAMNLTTSVAYKATDKLSLGAGFMIQYIDAHLTSMGGSVLEKVDLKGDTTDIGYTLGALYEFCDTTRVGVAYRSEVSHKLKGEGTQSGPVSSQDITAALTTPDVLTLGVYHDVNEKWAVMAEAQRTGWSSFETLAIMGSVFDYPEVEEKWKDVWFYSLGANYQLNEQTKLRFGVAYDQEPVSPEYKTMRIPDSDRIWLSTGVEYKYSDALTLNAGYTYIRAEDSSATINHGTPLQETIDYSGNIHLFGFGFNYSF